MENEKVEYFQPEIKEKRVWNQNNVFIAFIIGVVIVVVAFLVVNLMELKLASAIIFCLVLVFIYGVALFFLLEPKIIKEINSLAMKTVEKPVMREIIVDRPIVQEVVREVEKPVVREVTRPVYIQTPRKSLDIPRYEYVGSSETRTYHKRNCRLGKLIKKKYKINNNFESYFKKKGFKSCKVCIRKLKKV